MNDEFAIGDLIEFTIETELYNQVAGFTINRNTIYGLIMAQKSIRYRTFSIYWFDTKQIVPLLVSEHGTAFLSYTVLGYLKKLQNGINKASSVM